jgi:hypothetical protein
MDRLIIRFREGIPMKRIMTATAAAAFALVLLAPAAHARNLANHPVNLDQRNPSACSIVDGIPNSKSNGKVYCYDE